MLASSPGLQPPLAEQFAAHLVKLEQRGGPPASIMYGVAWVETGGTFNPRTRGRAGEVGIWQIHPVHHPPRGWTAQMDWAAAHLMGLKKKAGGSMATALAAYNGGWGGRNKAVCKRYARRVLAKAGRVKR